MGSEKAVKGRARGRGGRLRAESGGSEESRRPSWLGFRRHLEGSYEVPAVASEKPIGAGAYGIVCRGGEPWPAPSVPSFPRAA